MTRNRSEGWQYAKASGHHNEENIERLILKDSSDIKYKLHIKESIELEKTIFTGSEEKGVSSIIGGGKTKVKPDISLYWSDKSETKISIKKSLSGQVFLIKPLRFVDGFEAHYSTKIDADIVRAINLFFGSSDEAISILNNLSFEPDKIKIVDHMRRKKRLVYIGLSCYDKILALKLLEWLKNNIKKITEFVFSRGLAINKNDWASHLWYKNTLNENNIDFFISIDELCNLADENKNLINFSTMNGGSTIRLPFGFAQWHQESIQFHHDYKLIKKLYDESITHLTPHSNAPHQ